MLKNLIGWCARTPWMVLFLALMLGLAGLWSLKKTPLDAIPDLSDVQVIVFTEWPGRSPDLVEDQVTYPITSTLLSAPKVKAVRAQSMFGMSFVYAIFEDGTDMYWARSRVLEYMGSVREQLPEGVNPTLGPDASGVGWGFQYALIDESGQHNLADLRSFQDWNLRYLLRSVPGVADVASIGGFVKQYQITVDPHTLQSYQLSLEELSQAVRRSNNDVGGRSIEMTGREYMVRGRGYIRTLEDLENVVVKTAPGGTPVLLKHIARIQLGPELRRGVAELDGRGEVAGGIVVVRFGENVVDVLERVKTKIAEAEKTFPAGIKLVVTYDRSDLIHQSVATLRKTLLEECLVVSLVCIVFLFHVRSALVAIITLPLAVLVAFIPMKLMGVSANIMSLGGIAIAIGEMVDSAIVMVENAHKKLEQFPERDRKEVIIQAAQEVGPSLFSALLIITISFFPVFILQDQEGRLFKPLAYTKSFAMFFGACLSVTLVPALMVWFIRGKIYPEHKNPVTRLLIWLYEPVARIALRFRMLVILGAVAAVAITVPIYKGLGSEFMPRLWEGTSMYMPTTLPGVSITEATKMLQVQNKLLKTLPEVATVFGKVGRAETPTDPAPLSMVETVITFKPPDQWRPGMTPQKLESEMNQLLQIPGVSNGWTMPIKGRIDMLATGVRTPLGIKIFGPQLSEIEQLGRHIEAQLKPLPGTRNVFFERVEGGFYLDFDIKREAAARYGLRIGDIEDVIEAAVGGMNVSNTIEGRERYPIQIRYARELRDDPEQLKRILVMAPNGTPVPLMQVADIRVTTGPPMIRSEGGQLLGIVFIDPKPEMDPGTYVTQADQVLQTLNLQPGYRLEWSGQYEFMKRATQRLLLVVPVTLLLIFLLLYQNFKSITEALMVMLSLPFAMVGAFWALQLLGYNLSVAVWVGIIALTGVAAETGIVMLLYLDEVYHSRLAAGTLSTRSDLLEAIVEGAVMRVRPKLMTVITTVVGLLPIMYSHEIGSDIMKPFTAPLIGGMVSSTLLTLIVIPCLYMLWKERALPRGTHVSL
jgi:Cu(I)/Ag(I) efflux system membrane protein CusA/SilA